MPNYQLTVRRIRDIVVRKIPVDPAEAATLAADYSVIANEAVRRLEEVYEHLNRGFRSEAIHLAETPPPLLDVFAALDFEGLDVWTTYTINNNLPVPPSINAGKIQALQEAYGKQEALEPLQKAYRRLSVKGGSFAEKIVLVRRIRAGDAANPNWNDDLRALEVARYKEIAEALRKPEAINEETAEGFLKELTDKLIVIPPAETLVQSARELHQKLKAARVQQSMEYLIDRLNKSTAANDYAVVDATLTELDDLSKKEGVAVPAARATIVDDARYWHKEQRSQRDVTAAFTAECARLTEMLDAAAEPADVRKALTALAKMEREVPEELRHRAESYVSKHETAVKRKQQLKLAAIGAGALAVLLLVGWIVASYSASSKRAAIAMQIRHFGESKDFSGGERFIHGIEADAPALLDEPGIHDALAEFKKGKSDEAARTKRLEMDFALAAKLDEPFAPNIDTSLNDASALCRTDEEKAQLAECKANVESVRFKRREETTKLASAVLTQTEEVYKSARGITEFAPLDAKLREMDELVLKLEGFQGLPPETKVQVAEYRKRHHEEKTRQATLAQQDAKTRDTRAKLERELAKARLKLPDLAEYCSEIGALEPSYGKIGEMEGLEHWKLMQPAYQASIDYGDKVSDLPQPKDAADVPSYPKFMEKVLDKVSPTLPDNPYTKALTRQRALADFHKDDKTALADFYKLLNHDLMTKMYQFEVADKQAHQVYFTGPGQSPHPNDEKVQLNVYLDENMKLKVHAFDASAVQEIVPAKHCALAAKIKDRLHAWAQKTEWGSDFPAIFRDALDFDGVNAWVRALLLQKMADLDKEKFQSLELTPEMETDIAALSTDKLNFWMTEDDKVQEELKNIAARLETLKPKLKSHLDEIINNQPAIAKAQALALTRPLRISAVCGLNASGSRTAQSVGGAAGGQAFNEYWTVELQNGAPAFRIAAVLGSDGNLKWLHPEQVVLGQPLLSPTDRKNTAELFEQCVKTSGAVPPLWPVNVGEVKAK